jgi:hypothetical protein
LRSWQSLREARPVLSSAKIGTSSWRYYTDGVACKATEYYLGVGEAPGRWHGRGLEELGLTVGGRVDERQLEALFARGLHPGTGDRLGRAWRADAVTGFDLTFSGPEERQCPVGVGRHGCRVRRDGGAPGRCRGGPCVLGHARRTVPPRHGRGRAGPDGRVGGGVVRSPDQPGRARWMPPSCFITRKAPA